LSWFSEITIWAKSLDEKWKLAQADGQTFSDFAFHEMQNHSFHKNFELQKNIQEILELQTYPEQVNPHSKFGDPPITLYVSEDKSFYLDLYIWVESQTSIHQHNFEGAFTVLQGQSLETEYSFTPKRAMDPSAWGPLTQKDLIHLKPGDVRQIFWRDGLIHRVLHISKPTISLVLRTGKSEAPYKLPQYNYDFGLLASPGFPSGDVVAKMRALAWYLKAGHVPTYKMVEPLIPYAELWSTLAHHPQAKILLFKLAFIQNEPELLKGVGRQHLFLKLFSALKEEDERILLTAYEHFGKDWTTWVEKHFSLTPDLSVSKLRIAIRSLSWVDEEVFNLTFLKELFE
jgi:hypothetical protein